VKSVAWKSRLDELATHELYKDLVEKEHLKEWLGYHCVDEGEVYGTAGSEPARNIVVEVGRADIWPPDPAVGVWSEDAIFDFLQFIGQKVSSAVAETGSFHSYNRCGWHGEDFTPEPARGLYVTRVNKILERYGDGWEMKSDFEIVERAPTGTAELLTVKLPPATGAATRRRVQNAVAKFRRRSSSRDDRRDAVRDLGDVLEWLRKDATKHLSRKDESDRMAQGVLPFKYEAEKNRSGMTALAGLPTYLELASVCGALVQS
jgi:hypothetical protein